MVCCGSRRGPVVSVTDGPGGTLGWIGAAVGVTQLPLGAEAVVLTPDHVVNAALIALDRQG